MHPTRRLTTIPVLLTALAACGPEAPSDDPSAPRSLPVWVASETPRLDIGVLEGDDALMLEQVVDVLLLPGGEIAVSDAQAARVSIFSDTGEPLREWGGQGDGPGEFRSLSRLYHAPGDSLLALDASGRRASVFDRDGTYAREIPAMELSGDSLFAMDVWLHRRFVVDGVLTPDERAPVRAALDALPRPTDPGYRWVRVASDGRLWLREPGSAGPGRVRWLVLSPDGQPERWVDLPDRLDADELARDEVIGRYLGPNDVNYVRAYALRESDEAAPAPAWLADPAPVAEAGPAPEDFEAALQSAIRGAAMAQEIHYSTHFRYSDVADSLEMEPKDGVAFHFWRADDRGWTGVAIHPALDRMCGLGYGAATPPGWMGGRVVCGR